MHFEQEAQIYHEGKQKNRMIDYLVHWKGTLGTKPRTIQFYGNLKRQ